jgi:putative transposase
MSQPRYLWRQLTPEKREELLEWRKENHRPWHSPPHRAGFGTQRFHITAACFEHSDYIGHSPERMDSFSHDLLNVFASQASKTFAWCVLPNHYHALVETPDVLELLTELGKLHGRSSFIWNGEESTRGRQVFFRAVERTMRSERHYYATLNYVHHNPVRHGYVEKWADWRWGSAAEYLSLTSQEEAKRIWNEFPLGDYGKGWDDPDK